MKKNLLWMLAAILFCHLTAVSLTACSSSDDDSPSGGGTTPEVEKPDTTILSLTYHNFIKPDDVTILDSDTTKLSVSKALIDKMGATQLKGRRLAVWQKVSRLPFYRGIVSAQLSGDRYLLDLKRISLAEFMKGISFKFRNNMYYNSAASTTRSITRSNGTRGEVTDVSARYTDPEGYVHPAAVLYTDLSMKGKSYAYVPTGYDAEDDPVFTDTEHTRSMVTRAASDFDGDYDYFTPEQGGNFSMDVIDLNILLEKKLKFDFNPDSITVKINMPLKAKIHLWGDIEYGWFDLDFVGFSLCGSMEFSPELLIGFSGGFELPLRNIKVLEIPYVESVIMAGIVPVTISMNPSLYIRPYFLFDASMNFGFKYEWKGDFDTGASWDEDEGFNAYRYANTTGGDGFKFIPPQATGTVKAMFGFAIGGEVTLFNVAGLEIYTGPKVELKSNMKFSPLEPDPDKMFSFNASADFSLTSDVSFKIGALGVNLATWDTSFTYLGPYNIWKYPE